LRYYDIIIGNGNNFLNQISAGGARFTSHPNGPSNPPDPGALNVEMDLVTYPGEVTAGESWGSRCSIFRRREILIQRKKEALAP